MSKSSTGAPTETAETTAVTANADNRPERFDDILGRLRGLVDKLESGNLSLEESLRFFEEGVALCRRGTSVLDAAEKKVEVLLTAPDPSGRGEVRVAPFDTGLPAGASEVES